MRFLDYFRTALKNLWRQKARSFLTILAVVIGAISVTVMLSLVLAGRAAFMGSMEASGALTLVTVSATSEIQNDKNGDLFNTNNQGDTANKLTDVTLASVRNLSHLKGATPLLDASKFEYAYLKGQEKKFRPALTGYDPSAGAINSDVQAGRPLRADDLGKVVIGAQALRDFGYAAKPQEIIGQKMVLKSASRGDGWPLWAPDPPKPADNGGDDKTYWENLNNQSFELELDIIGVMDSGAMGERQNYVSLAFAKQLGTSKRWDYDKTEQDAFEATRKANDEAMQRLQQEQKWNPVPGKNYEAEYKKLQMQPPQRQLVYSSEFDRTGYPSIVAKIDDTENVESVAAEVRKLNLSATTAKDMIDDFMRIFTILAAVLGGIGMVSLLVASIGIINTMVMAIYERIREIGVMRACGASQATVRRLFTFEAAALGFWGGVIGLLISFAFGKIGNIYLNNLSVEQNLPLTNIISFPWWLVAGVIGLTTVIGLLAGLYPAHRAAKMDPVEALRYE